MLFAITLNPHSVTSVTTQVPPLSVSLGIQLSESIADNSKNRVYYLNTKYSVSDSDSLMLSHLAHVSSLSEQA